MENTTVYALFELSEDSDESQDESLRSIYATQESAQAAAVEMVQYAIDELEYAVHSDSAEGVDEHKRFFGQIAMNYAELQAYPTYWIVIRTLEVQP